jgi:hypothetical protein
MAIWDPEIELELDEGEHILLMCRHHWVLLLRNAAIPLVIGLVAGGFAFVRSLGIAFFVTNTGVAQQLDWISILLLVGLAALIVTWVRGVDLKAKKGKQKIPIDLTWAVQLGMLLIGLLLWYRYQGGRVLEFDSSQAQPFDLVNIILITIASICLLALVYIAIDWRDDSLVLTNTRIILDKDELLIRHVQQQILLVDVQQFSMRQSTYPQVIFGYGSISVQSYSLKRIYFDFATRPQQMEQRIRDELTKTRRAIEPNLVRRLIAERVFDEKRQAPHASHRFHVETKGADRTGLLRWLFPPNPEIDERSGQIVWRPSSVYVGLILLRPFSIWLVATLILAFVFSSLGDATWMGVLAWVLITLVCAAWIFWLREEYVEDIYILNKREIIDVDRRPFGPVNRRNAPIDRIQNISFDISFVEQLLGFGTVKIQTGGSGDFSFNHVPDPRGVQAMINDYLTDFKKTTEERNLQNNVDIFREYHGLQRDKGELMNQAAIDRAMEETARTAVNSYANEIAPIQIALEVREALRAQSRLERRDRVRRLLRRRGSSGQNTP